MTYRVVWLPRHQNDLLVLEFSAWQTGADADAIPRATEAIGRMLRTDPHGVGLVRTDSERMLTVEPLTVTYEVFEGAGVVLIYEYEYHW